MIFAEKTCANSTGYTKASHNSLNDKLDSRSFEENIFY